MFFTVPTVLSTRGHWSQVSDVCKDQRGPTFPWLDSLAHGFGYRQSQSTSPGKIADFPYAKDTPRPRRAIGLSLINIVLETGETGFAWFRHGPIGNGYVEGEI